MRLNTLKRILGCCLVPAAALSAQRIDTTRALAGLRDAAAACAADAGALWHHSLCGPIALADRQTRIVIANDTVPRRHYLPLSDAFVSLLPDGQFLANTSFQWNDRSWTMVMLPLPADRYRRISLVMHEVFHREQRALGLAALDALNNHLDFRPGRTWLRLEYRALAAALRATDSAAVRRHVGDALVFRAYRRSLYPTADSTETLLEIQEGLPEYTGQHLALQMTGEGPARVAQYLDDFERTTPSFVRAFAYGSGPAIGVLLDHLAPAWRDTFVKQPNLSAILARAIGFSQPGDLKSEAAKRATGYGLADVDRGEAARDSERAPQTADYQLRFGSGSVITLNQSKDSLMWGYDPTALVAFDERNLIYPSGTFAAAWGKLQVDSNGVYVANDFKVIRVSIKDAASALRAGNKLSGDGWTLDIAPGWALDPDPRRSGSLVLRRR